MHGRVAVLMVVVTVVICQPFPALVESEDLSSWGTLPRNMDNRPQPSSVLTLLGPKRGMEYLCHKLKNNVAARTDVMLALRGLADLSAVQSIMQYALTDEYYSVREMAIETLARIGVKEAIPELLRIIREDPEKSVRSKVYTALAVLDAEEAVPELLAKGERILPLYREDSGDEIGKICMTLRVLGDTRAIPFLQKILTYPFEGEVATTNLPAEAAKALATLGDRSSVDWVVAKFPERPAFLYALHVYKHPVALKRAREIMEALTTDNIEGLDRDEAWDRWRWFMPALRIFIDNGTEEDVPFLKRIYKNRSREMEIVFGGEPPFWGGEFYVHPETIPIFFAWAFAELGDEEGFQILKGALEGRSDMVASEAARVFVRMKQTDQYEAVARSMRRLVSRSEYSTAGRRDPGVFARKEMMNMLAKQRSPEALRLLVRLLNDSNSNVVSPARWAILSYPASQWVPLVEQQLLTRTSNEPFLFPENSLLGYAYSPETWEKWQMAYQLEFAEEGLQTLLRIAQSNEDVFLRSIALRAVIRNQLPGWRNLLRSAAAYEEDLVIKEEVIKWACHYFEETEPNILPTCPKAQQGSNDEQNDDPDDTDEQNDYDDY